MSWNCLVILDKCYIVLNIRWRKICRIKWIYYDKWKFQTGKHWDENVSIAPSHKHNHDCIRETERYKGWAVSGLNLAWNVLFCFEMKQTMNIPVPQETFYNLTSIWKTGTFMENGTPIFATSSVTIQAKEVCLII